MSYVVEWSPFLAVSAMLLVAAVRAAQLRLSRQASVLVLGVGKRGWLFALEFAFAAGLVAWIADVFLWASDAHLRVFPPALEAVVLDWQPAKVTGALMFLMGGAIFLWALASMGRSWRVGIDERRPGPLVTAGAFAWSRNPIFLFMDLYAVGVFLVHGTWAFLVCAVAIAAGIHAQILHEERFLRRKHGAPYESYCARVHRYFGRIPAST